MTISPSYPNLLQNGNPADASQVMANFYQIQNDVNANAAANGANSSITSLTGLTTPLGIIYGGTGAISAAAALTALGAAPLASPALTGAPTAPTAAPGTNTTQLATTAFAQAADAALLISPALTGTPTVPTAALGTNTTQIASTAFVQAAAPTFASKAQMQAASSTTTVVNPAQTQNHPGVAKAWVTFNGSTGVILDSYNISSLTRNGTGDYTANFTTSFANTSYTVDGNSGTQIGGGANVVNIVPIQYNTGSCRVGFQNGGSGGFFDNTHVNLIFFGTQ